MTVLRIKAVELVRLQRKLETLPVDTDALRAQIDEWLSDTLRVSKETDHGKTS